MKNTIFAVFLLVAGTTFAQPESAADFFTDKGAFESFVQALGEKELSVHLVEYDKKDITLEVSDGVARNQFFMRFAKATSEHEPSGFSKSSFFRKGLKLFKDYRFSWMFTEDKTVDLRFDTGYYRHVMSGEYTVELVTLSSGEQSGFILKKMDPKSFVTTRIMLLIHEEVKQPSKEKQQEIPPGQ